MDGKIQSLSACSRRQSQTYMQTDHEERLLHALVEGEAVGRVERYFPILD
jgi:hypothetical protein